MKAINCTQCGAVLENVRENSVVVECDYCGARFVMPKKENAQGHPPASYDYPIVHSVNGPDVPYGLKLFGIAVIVGIGLVFAGITLFASESAKRKQSAKSPVPTYSPVPYKAPSIAFPTPVPSVNVPEINYQPRVSWNGPNDMEHFEEPQLDISSVAHLSENEIRKTVFKNNRVTLSVVINTDGEIDDARIISGHPLLAVAAYQSAQRTIFTPRKKPTNRILTYTFRLLKD